MVRRSISGTQKYVDTKSDSDRCVAMAADGLQLSTFRVSEDEPGRRWERHTISMRPPITLVKTFKIQETSAARAHPATRWLTRAARGALRAATVRERWVVTPEQPLTALGALPDHSTGESFPSSAFRTILIGGNPCCRNASWNPCNVYFPPFIFL